ncbi:MAG TPA: GT-D fold domain-containing glycosyltransferase [Bacilli bacterium]
MAKRLRRLRRTALDPQRDNGEYERGRAEGYAAGIYAGGEQLVERNMPPDTILPNISVEQIIAAGIPRFRESFKVLHPVQAVYERLQTALSSHRPFSLVRLGDGELLVLAQEKALPIEEVLKRGEFLPQAGVRVPDLSARDLVAQAVAKANMVGVPANRLPNFLLLLSPALAANEIDIMHLEATYSTVNYMLLLAGYLRLLMDGRRTVVVGNRADALTEHLRAAGFSVCDPVFPVNGIDDVHNAIQQIAAREFDLALVSAGIPAVVIAQQIAEKFGRVAIDFGHAADSIIKGEAQI